MTLEDELLEHLWRRHPEQGVIVTDPGIRRAIAVAIERARGHGFVERPEVRGYLTLMVFLGGHFDEDPQLEWAGAVLRDSAAQPRPEVMAALLGETSTRLRLVVGRRGGHYRRALARARDLDFEAIAARSGDEDGLHDLLDHLYHRKYDSLGEFVVRELIVLARSRAADHGLTTPAGVGVYLGLMFLLGSGFDRDPFHPWAASALAAAARAEGDPDTRARMLHAEGLEMLGRYTRLDRLGA